MSVENGARCISLIAAADLSAKQYYGVDIDSAGKAALVSAAGQRCIGVLQNKPTSGQVATVMVSGKTKMVTASVIAGGALVGLDSAGKATTAVKATTDASGASATAALVGSYVLGVHLGIANSASGDLVEVELLHLGAVPTTAA